MIPTLAASQNWKKTTIRITHIIRSWSSVFTFKYFFHWLNLQGNTNRGNELQHLGILFFIIPSCMQVELWFKCHEKKWLTASGADQKDRKKKWSFLQLTQAFSNNFMHQDVYYVIFEMVTWMQGFFFQFSDNFVNLAIFSTICVNLVSKFYTRKYIYIQNFPHFLFKNSSKFLGRGEKKRKKFVNRN